MNIVTQPAQYQPAIQPGQTLQTTSFPSQLDEIEPQEYTWHSHVYKCTVLALVIIIISLLVTRSFITLAILAGAGAGALIIAKCINWALTKLLTNHSRPSPDATYPGTQTDPENAGDAGSK